MVALSSSSNPDPPENLLGRVAAAIARTTTLETAVVHTLEELCGAMGCELGHAYLPDEGGQLASTPLWWPAAPGASEGLRRKIDGLRFARHLPLPAQVLAAGEPAWLADLSIGPCASEHAAAGLTSGLAFPLRAGSEVVGVLELYSRRAPPSAAAWRELLGAIGDLLGRVGQRRRAEQALLTSEAQFRTTFERASFGMVMVDAEGRIREANPAFARMLGYQPAELYLISVDTLLHPADRAATRRRLAEVNQGGEPDFAHQRRLIHKDGSTRWCDFSGSWLSDGQTRPRYALTIVQDVTAQKASERAVRELSGRLLHLQDQERRKIARALHESPAQNLAALAVNLAIIEKSAALEGRARTALEESLRLIEQCSREIRTLSHLLHPPLLEEIGLAAALRWYVDGFVRRSAIAVTLDVPHDLARLPVELETTLFRAVQESLTNIHRHSGSPSARIRLVEDKTHVRVEVADQGRGIRSAQALEEAAPGSVGVGIAGMRERIRQLAGELTIDSGPSGTQVRISLPRRSSS